MTTYPTAPRAATLSYLGRRILSIAAGAALLAILSHAIVDKTGQTGSHAAMTYGVAAALVAASIVLGDMSRAVKAGVIATMIAIEIGTVLASAEIVMMRRDAAAAEHRTKAGAHAHAIGELVKADAALAAARDAVTREAAKKDCKKNCANLLDAAVVRAEAARTTAVALVEANPAPARSPSPFADMVGISAGTLDLLIAAMFACANGLAAFLIAHGAHAQRSAAAHFASSRQTSFPADDHPLPSPAIFAPFDEDDEPAKPNPREETVRSFVDAYRAKHGANPPPSAVRRATGLPRSTAHRYQQKVQRRTAG